jgi:hypothetical protein
MDDAPDNRFERLTEDEIAAAHWDAQDAPEQADGELVAPIRADAPEPPRAHPKWGKPSGSWTYRSASGTALQIIFRFDPAGERKQFLPCTLWRTGAGLSWRWKGLPSPRPLYGVERLAARPGAPVIVCEGEKSADAAQIIFPDHVAVASAGGSRAAAKTDWGPLAGRRVVIWPDNDEPGADYAREVAAILSGLGCEVAVIDAAVLVAIDGGARGPNFEPIGWDSANAIAEWLDTEALWSAALGLAKPYAAIEAGAGEAKSTPGEEDIRLKLPAATIAEIKLAAATLKKDDISGATRLVEVALIAKASKIETDQIIKALAKSLGVPKAGVADLWRDVEHRTWIRNAPTVEDLSAQREAERRAREAKHAEIYERCKEVA